MVQTTPLQALNHIRSSLENIGRSKSVSDQLSRYAINCYDYSMKSKFAETFKSLYVSKQGRAQDNMLKKKSGVLSKKAVDSAVEITDKALHIVKESTLRSMEVSDQDELVDKETESTDDEEFEEPAGTIDHSPNQPKLPNLHIESLLYCYI